MTEDIILGESRNYITQLMSETRFKLPDPEMFIHVGDGIQIGGLEHSIFIAKFLTCHPIEGQQLDLKYTFAVLRPPTEHKMQYHIHTARKQINQPHDAEFLDAYFARYLPVAPDMPKLLLATAVLLVGDILPGRGYSFRPHAITPTADLDMACAFYEQGSLKNFSQPSLLSRFRKAVGF